MDSCDKLSFRESSEGLSQSNTSKSDSPLVPLNLTKNNHPSESDSDASSFFDRNWRSRSENTLQSDHSNQVIILLSVWQIYLQA